MSFFNPIRSQFRRLEKVFRDDPALDLRYAAGLMHVAPEKVAHSIQIMIERQFFTPDVPVVDNRLSVLIRDQRYLELATLKRKTQKLQQSLQTAGSASERVMQVPGYNNVGRSQVFGSFVRDILDSALASPTPGSAIRSRAGSFFRDFLEPDHRTSIAKFLNNDIAAPLSMLLAQCRQLAECLSSRPDQEWNPEFAPFLDRVTGIVNAWSSCIPKGSLPTEGQLRTADKLSDRLEYEFVPQFQALLEDIYHPKPRQEKPAEPPHEEQDPVLADLEEKKRSFRSSLQKIKKQTLVESGAVLDKELGQIIAELAVHPGKSGRASIRSLQNTYLPMMQELADKYAENESTQASSPQVLAAMKTTEQLFEDELPAAMQRILDDLHQESAIDLVSQANALRGKLKLDGLIQFD